MERKRTLTYQETIYKLTKQYTEILKLKISFYKIQITEDKEFSPISRLMSILKAYESFLGWIWKPKLYGDYKTRLIILGNHPCPQITNLYRGGLEYF